MDSEDWGERKWGAGSRENVWYTIGMEPLALPLIVPVTLIRHYVRKFGEQYLLRQHYLDPHPVELMLRNHV